MRPDGVIGLTGRAVRRGDSLGSDARIAGLRSRKDAASQRAGQTVVVNGACRQRGSDPPLSCYRICIRVPSFRAGACFNWLASEVLEPRYAARDPEPRADADCFEGNFQAYIEDLKRRKGPDADQPHRIAYRKLVRA